MPGDNREEKGKRMMSKDIKEERGERMSGKCRKGKREKMPGYKREGRRMHGDGKMRKGEQRFKGMVQMENRSKVKHIKRERFLKLEKSTCLTYTCIIHKLNVLHLTCV